MKTKSQTLIYDGEKERTERQVKKEMNKIVQEMIEKEKQNEKVNG